MILPRLMIAAPASGGGKTLVTCGLLRALARRERRVIAFKCGPDYIDPAFHRTVLGAPSFNLDGYFTDAAQMRGLMVRAAQDAQADIALVEGVMGYYDGLACDSTEASSYAVARATGTPALLVVDTRGTALSAAATIKGFATFRSDAQVAGVILNRCSPAVAERVAPAIERETGVPVLGCVPRDDRFELVHRHLGLVMPGEREDLLATMDALADQLERTVDLGRVLSLAAEAPRLDDAPFRLDAVTNARPRIAVARDEAFCFLYEENVRTLVDLGAELVFFSPLHDDDLPTDCGGLYLSGGYPELHARELAGNERMRMQIRAAVLAGLPTVAECGGFMYLQDELCDEEGVAYPMAGVLRGRCANTGRLTQFGYVELTAQEGGALFPAGTVARAHEFHYWHSTDEGSAWRAQKPRSARGWSCGVALPNLMAGFPHVYYPGEPDIARRFVLAAAAYSRR